MNNKYRPKFVKAPLNLISDKVAKPYVVVFWVSGQCNFKCRYCIHSASQEVKARDGVLEQCMDWELFLTAAEQMKSFSGPIYAAVFCGIGEPLTHKRLPDMVRYLKENRITRTVEVTTNASLLTPDISRSLIDAGLDGLNVSIQGLNRERYRQIAGVDMDVDKLRDNIAFFYQARKQCHVHIKTVDIALGEGEREVFFERFEPICDTMYIDHVMPAFKHVNYSGLLSGVKDQYTGEPIDIDNELPCTVIFGALNITPEGDVVPCELTPSPLVLGNVKETTLIEMWRSQKRKDFLALHMDHQRGKHPICHQCVVPPIYHMTPADE